ncbi:FKBP-type peptidyl-prolyl cis-trans isomerase [Agromyces sp. SYSU T00194]|uniref:FKBP-type peptidyl-prolyl cis-trans isomerase n=1 Tax=Agromyces chitinivorans TaxID=3158560 RepID=UPI003393C983
MHRTLRRAAPIALLSASALLLAGCASTPDEPDATTEAGACLEVASGAESDSVEVSGDFGVEPTATFDVPLEADDLQRTVVTEGDGDATEAGDAVTAQISVFSGTTGDLAFSQEATLTVADETIFPAFLAGIDCLPVGTRTVTIAPAAELFGDEGNADIGIAGGETVVIVSDLVDRIEPAVPQDWTEDVPDVTFDDAGLPTVTLPDTDPSDDLLVAVLEEGDGAEVAGGDTVTVQYQGISWDTGEIFDQSYGGDPISFSTAGVIEGFGAALVGQTVGTQLIVSIPPRYAYGEEGAGQELSGQTLVFLIEIEDTAAAAG